MIYEVSATITTAADGTATVYLGTRLRGRVHAIKYAPGTLDTGADLTITGETTGVAILTKANAGTSTVWYYPRAFPNQVTDGTAGATPSEDVHVVNERIMVAVVQGGATLTGTITVYIDAPEYP